MIAKRGGGERPLGIPNVLDRVIQQAIAQILGPIFDPGFSASSFGFRPHCSAHGALKQVQAYVKAGYRIAVDLDLAKFFDNVDHDILMARVASQGARQESAGADRGLPARRRHGGGGVSTQRAGHARKAVRSRRCWPTSCSMTWTGNWSVGGCALPAMPTI